MAGVTLGFLRYVLGLDTLQFRKGMTQAERDLVVMQKRFDKVGQQMVGLGKNLTLGFTAPLAAFAAKGIKEAQETADAMGQVNAALASMGPVAGRSAEQLSKMADGLETSSLFEADEILRKVTANLLTFGNISGKSFDRAQQAAVDLATRMGTDLQSATLLVGKALNDPIKGMTALGRAGIQFTAAQKETIKAMVEGGNAAGAQALILKELERQFGGSAAAAQNTDPWNKLSDAFNQMAEKVGTALLPLIPPLTNAIISVANAFTALSPETQKWILIIGGVAAVLGPVLIGLGSLVSLIATIGPAVTVMVAAWKAFVGVMTLARVVSLALLPSLIPILVPLGAIALAVGAVYLAWKNWDKIKAVVADVVSRIKAQLATLLAPFKWVIDQVKKVGDAFFKLYDRVVGHSYVPDMVDEIGAQMQRLDAVLVAPVAAATGKAAEAFRDLQQKTKGLLDRLFPEAAALNTLREELATLEAAMKRGILTANQYAAARDRLMGEGLKDEPISVLETPSLVPANDDVAAGLGNQVDAALGRIPELAAQANDALANVAQNGVASLADGLTAVVMGTAKLGDVFRQVAAQILSDLIRIQIQKLLTSLAGSVGLPGFGGARASGGPVMGGKAYLVGEKGPELFAPGRAGRIIANDDLRSMRGGGGGDTYNFQIPPGMTPREGRATGQQLARGFQERMAFASTGRRR